MGPEGLYDLLRREGIPFQRFDHPPVYTCGEAERLIPDLPGTPTKNLFLRDRKGKRHFLVAVGYGRSVDLAALSGQVGVDRLLMASARRLEEMLGVEPGAVTLLGLANDGEHRVELVVDRDLWSPKPCAATPW